MSLKANAQKASTAKGLKHWHKELLKVSLPALASTGQQLKKQLQDPDCSLRDIEVIVAEDPVLSFQLLTQANLIRTTPENDVLSLPHALSLLGMDKLQPLLKNIKYIQFDPNKVAHNAFLQALNISLHAATQAFYIAEKKNSGSGEGHYWISLRLSSVFWLLSLASPKTYHGIEQRVLTGESRHIVEKEILGCTTQELTRSMLKDWQLSKFTQEHLNKLLNPSPKMLATLATSAWQDGFAPEIKRAQHIFLQTPWVAAVFAHWLALNTAVNWQTPKTDRIERMISVYLNSPLNDVITFLHQNAVHCSKAHVLEGVWSPAIKLLHPPLEKRSIQAPTVLAKPERPSAETIAKAKRYKDLSSDTRKRAELSSAKHPAALEKIALEKPVQKKAVQETVVQEKEKAAEPIKQTAVSTTLFKLFYLQTVKQQQVFSIHQIMDGASQVLNFDLGLTRCILFMKSKKEGAVKGVYAKGFTDNTPFGEMALSADNQHLFGKLLSKQAALWVTKETQARFVPQLPKGLWSALEQPDEFVLSSILLRGDVSGILYADNKGSNKKLDASSYATFRGIAQAISHGMGTLAGLKEKEKKEKKEKGRKSPPMV